MPCPLLLGLTLAGQAGAILQFKPEPVLPSRGQRIAFIMRCHSWTWSRRGSARAAKPISLADEPIVIVLLPRPTWLRTT